MTILRDYADLIFLLVFSAGVFIIIKEDVHMAVSRLKLRRSLKQRNMNMKRPGSLEGHISRLLRSCGSEKRPSDLIRSSALWAVLSGTGAGILCGPAGGITGGAAAGLIPYIILRMRCSRRKKAIAGEGERLVSTILSSYRMSCGKMEEALEYTARQTQDLPFTSRMIAGLLLRLRECSTEEGMRIAVEEAALVPGLGWSKVLGVNIRLACARGTDVSGALETLLGYIRDSKILMQERLRDNSESGRMTYIMIPLAMAVTVFLAKSQTGLSLVQLAGCQFGDPAGAVLFMLILVLFIFNVAAGRFVRDLNIYTG